MPKAEGSSDEVFRRVSDGCTKHPVREEVPAFCALEARAVKRASPFFVGRRMRRVGYRYIVESEAAFIQQLAVSYVGKGFWFYVAGRIPEGKDPARTDEKLLRRYLVNMSKWARARRKKSGLGNVHYLRFGRFFVLLASHGAHRFFLDEAFNDCRRSPIKAFGYAVSYRKGVDGKGHPSVRIGREEYKRVKSYFESIACARTAEALARELGALPFEPYAPVRRQLLNILRGVNRARMSRGFEPLSHAVLRLKSSPRKVFAEEGRDAA